MSEHQTEIILNLWYICDETSMIYSLLARPYVACGCDEEKLQILRSLAPNDWEIAQHFPIPKRFHTLAMTEEGQKTIDCAEKWAVDGLGGMFLLFEDAFVQLDSQIPPHTKLRIGNTPLYCITPIVIDDKGRLHPKIKKRSTGRNGTASI